MNTFFCRAFQCCFAVGARFLPWRTPEVFSGEGSLLRAAEDGGRAPRQEPRAEGEAALEGAAGESLERHGPTSLS